MRTSGYCYSALLVRLLRASQRFSPERAAVLGMDWERWAGGRTFGERGTPGTSGPDDRESAGGASL